MTLLPMTIVICYPGRDSGQILAGIGRYWDTYQAMLMPTNNPLLCASERQIVAPARTSYLVSIRGGKCLLHFVRCRHPVGDQKLG